MKPRELLERAQVLLPRAHHGVAVLAYHLVGGTTDSPVDLPLDVFRAQLDRLAATRRVRSLGAALGGAPRDEAFVLTFDDAYRNFREVAWPLLVERGLPATLYVPVDFVDGSGASPIRGVTLPPLSWADLRAMVAEGLTVGSHSVTHRNLRRLAPAEVERELEGSRKALEDRLGVAVTSFCYPQAKSSRAAERLAGRCYESAVVAGGRRFTPGRVDRRAIPRLPVRRDLRDFDALLTSPLWLSEAVASALRQVVP
ncbi:MAG: polysaccharide deacetylase family protein [Deltaproteobacteria bacterium]|nr:polysaccharide deacetylase family protein [Deltaproteobacteria bacterium]